MIMKKIRGIVQLFRPELAAAAGICVVAGEIIAIGKFPSINTLLLGFVCGFLISSPALILNDYFDLEVDRINAPDRPLPSGTISSAEAIALTVGTTVLALAAAYMISSLALILCIILWAIGVLYNWKLKETGLPGNLMVGISVASTFVLGGISVGEPWNRIILTFSLAAFLFDFAEEVAGDAMDISGDKERNSKSLAIRMGRDTALRISSLLFALFVLVSLIPAFLDWFGTSYLIMISTTDILVVYFVLKLLKSKTAEEGRLFMRRTYISASLGMLAFVIARFFI